MDDTNVFIQKAHELMDNAISKSKETGLPVNKPVTKEKKFGIFKHLKKESSDDKEDKIDSVSSVYILSTAFTLSCNGELYNENSDLPFNILWDYAEFIRWCEKMFIYENNSDQELISDTPLDAIDCRTLIVNKKGFFIHINLKMSQKADFDNKSDKLIFHEIKEINIKRSYGKEMSNKFRVTDNNIKFNDDSDKLLYTIVNEIIYDAVRNHFWAVMRNIENGNFLGNKLFNRED